jgi:hypothetical protein
MDGLLSVTAKDIRKCCWRNEDLYIEEVVLKKPDLEKRNRNLLNYQYTGHNLYLENFTLNV